MHLILPSELYALCLSATNVMIWHTMATHRHKAVVVWRVSECVGPTHDHERTWERSPDALLSSGVSSSPSAGDGRIL